MSRQMRGLLKFLGRPAPYTLLNWRFFLPSKSPAVRLHRAVFWASWRQRPRLAWALIKLLVLVRWYLFQGWRFAFRAWRRYAGPVRRAHGLGRGAQAMGLLTLALGYGAPPSDYYRYGLFEQPRDRWLDWVFVNELPGWHHVLGGARGPGREEIRLLGDKAAFARRMAEAGLSPAPVLGVLARGQRPCAADLGGAERLMIKPRAGSKGRDCYTLRTRAWRLSGAKAAPVEGKTAVLEFLAAKAADEDYVIQPLLANHPLMEELAGHPPALVTIRVVTAWTESGARFIGAVLEKPLDEDGGLWEMAGVEGVDGTLLHRARPLERLLAPAPRTLGGGRVPFWDGILGMCLKAHALVPGMFSVGWDAALTPAGPVLLEGNVNWNVVPLQLYATGPLLSTALAELYAARVL